MVSRSTQSAALNEGPTNSFACDVLITDHDVQEYREGYIDVEHTDLSLVFEVDIRVEVERPTIWYPKLFEPETRLVEKYRQRSETAHATFVLPDETKFPAHRSVLSDRANGLSEIAEKHNSTDGNGEDIDNRRCTPIPVSQVDGGAFSSILEFVYTVCLPNVEDMDTTQKILVTANKFNCTDLKLHAESILVEKFLTAETAAALLILADSHDCALLKEASMDFCVSEPSTVKQTEAWSNVQRTLRGIV